MEIHKGNLLENVTSGIIVHGCNAQGVMGAGFAKALKKKYPEAFDDYYQLCKLKSQGYYEYDSVLGHCSTVQINDDLFIVNAITQDRYGYNQKLVDYDAVRSCFKEVADLVAAEANHKFFHGKGSKNNIVTLPECILPVHFPKIGAGLGGGDWDTIAKIIEEELGSDVKTHLSGIRMTTYFISGHRNITSDEWYEHYVPQLEAAIKSPDSKFVVGDYYGVDAIAQVWLQERQQNVLVYHMFMAPRNNIGFPTRGLFTSDEERDAAMTRDSDVDIAWVRPGAEKSGTATNLRRRQRYLSKE